MTDAHQTGFKASRLARDPLLWSLYYAMLEANGIHSDGYGLYPIYYRCAQAAVDFMRANG